MGKGNTTSDADCYCKVAHSWLLWATLRPLYREEWLSVTAGNLDGPAILFLSNPYLSSNLCAQKVRGSPLLTFGEMIMRLAAILVGVQPSHLPGSPSLRLPFYDKTSE